jgi:hypothetical protein
VGTLFFHPKTEVMTVYLIKKENELQIHQIKPDQEIRFLALKINQTYAYWATKGLLIGMFIKRLAQRALDAFDKNVGANTEAIRLGRHNPRKKKPPRYYHMNYKDV